MTLRICRRRQGWVALLGAQEKFFPHNLSVTSRYVTQISKIMTACLETVQDRRRRRRTFSFHQRRGVLVTTAALLSFFVMPLSAFFCQAQRSDPSQFNGGSILAMAGRNSVAIAIDSRFGLGMQTISTGNYNLIHDDDIDGILTNDDRDKIMTDDQGRRGGSIIDGGGNPRILHLPNSNALLAWTGLYGDGIGFAEEMNVLLARKVRRAGMLGFGGSETKRKMSPRAITMLMSHLLYRRRNSPYYVEPVVVGLESVCVPILDEHPSNASRELELQSAIQMNALLERQTNNIPRPKITSYRTILKPYLCGTDMLGAQSSSQTFVCSGVASRSLHGTAEAMWKPNLNDDELVEVCGKAFLSALERDILSGYGAVVYLIKGGADENDVQIIEYVLACRND